MTIDSKLVMPTQEASGWNGDLKIFFMEKKNNFRGFVPQHDKRSIIFRYLVPRMTIDSKLVMPTQEASGWNGDLKYSS